jgi:F-type H+-transporting ATPase subunit epsilon
VHLLVSIVTPELSLEAMECDEVIVPGVHGELGLLAQHVPLISALEPGILTLVEYARDHTIGLVMGQARRHFVVSRGFVEISEDVVTILAQTCEPTGEIDEARARRALSEAEQALESRPEGTSEHELWAERARRARARLRGVALGGRG